MTDPNSLLQLADSFRAMPFRPALPMNRARILGLGLSVGIAIALGGCGSSGAPVDTKGSFTGNESLKLWTDPSTGCRYYIYSADMPANFARGGMTIRFRRDGTPDCPGKQSERTGA